MTASSRRLYVAAVSHLDTQWQWTLRDTIRRHLPRTLRENFRRFARFPRYVVNFDGSFRYRLIAEYYPQEFERLRQWIRRGRWAVVGSMLDAADVNIPSPESLLRHVLYGNQWFERELGVRCDELFLPDCFGFGYALPSIAAHCGLRGFSSQKLSKGRSAAPIPFALGRWLGPDGRGVIAALEPGGYGEPLAVDLARDPAWMHALDRQRELGGAAVGLAYYGVGDTGGALDVASLERLERAAATPDAPITVLPAPAGRLFQDLTPTEVATLPEHRGELLLSLHATGCYTSQAQMKRWNRANEQLGDAAERACVAAHLLAGAPLPTRELGEAWQRFLVHQFHDDLTGTSVPGAYALSWNDEAIALNQFGDHLSTAVGAVAARLDTRAQGTPLVVFNPLDRPRRDLVELDLASPAPVGVYDGTRALPTDCQAGPGRPRVRFVAELPAFGFKVFDLRPRATAERDTAVLRADPDGLENEILRVRLDAAGDIASIFDKRLGRELLARPMRLELLPDDSRRFPSWEIRYEDIVATAETLSEPEVLPEPGQAAALLRVRRRHGASAFEQTVRLAAGDSRLEIDLRLDWRTRGRLLKASFPISITEARAFYDLGLGVIERGVNTRRLYEVPAQQWAALEAADGFGIGLFNDGRTGWDRPAPDELRLTLLHSPRIGHRFRYQRRQDFGPHRVRYGIAAYAGGWKSGEIADLAARFNQPLRAFLVPPHPGPLGREASLFEVADGRLAVRACKGREDGAGIVLRLQELSGGPIAATIRLPPQVRRATAADGVERPLAPARPVEGALPVSLNGFEPQTVLLENDERSVEDRPVALELPYDLRATTRDGERSWRGFDGRGRSYPAELWPRHLSSGGTVLALGPADGPNAMRCRGQELFLPAATGERLVLLAASVGGVRAAAFVLGGELRREVPDWCAAIGRWNRLPGVGAGNDIQRVPVAWVATHRHGLRGNQAYQFCYLFRLELPLAPGTRRLRLPDDPAVRVFAAVITSSAAPAVPGMPLYD